MRLLTFALALFATNATAQEVTVQFYDGAPKDSITVTNSSCLIANATLVLDLVGSEGALIFDVTSTGAGVEVYQPVEVTSGSATLSPVRDGDKQLQLSLDLLPTGEPLSLSADLDDTLAQGHQVTVIGSEMAGASVSLTLANRVLTGLFNENGTARIAIPADVNPCLQS
jgi:hypothetical protein